MPRLRAGSALGLYLGLTGRRVVGGDTLVAGVASHLVSASVVGDVEAALGRAEEGTHAEVTSILSRFRLRSAACLWPCGARLVLAITLFAPRLHMPR